MDLIEGFHHLTACVEGAQEDVDFYTKVLGARLIKRTVLLDGRHGVYHLYYADESGSEGTILTSFPYRQRGIRGRRGTGQVKVFSLSVPVASLEFWAEHLDRCGVERGRIGERFGQRVLGFEHPAGLGFEVVEDDGDRRSPWTTAEIGAEHAIRGPRGVTLSLSEVEESERFMGLFGFRKIGEEGSYTRLELGEGGAAAATLDLLREPEVPAGTWTYAGGTVHHVAFAARSEREQLEIKAHLEGLGYNDVSEVKDRNYFRSIYVRSPGGVLVEVAVTQPGGFARDEAADRLGESLMVPPWFEDRREELVSQLEPITV